MYNTTGLSQKYLTECFILNLEQQLKIANSENAINYLTTTIAQLKSTLPSLLN